jgi:Fic family protein
MKLPQTPPDFAQLLTAMVQNPERFQTLVMRAIALSGDEAKYRHWDKLRRTEPVPEGLSREEWWFALKQKRLATFRPLPLLGVDGNPAWFSTPPEALDKLSRIDRLLGSEKVFFSDAAMTEENKTEFFIKALFEESISSSLIEGAVTTRDDARVMLATGDKPKNKSERMIANNYATIRFVRENAARELTPELLLEIHALITRDTLDDSAQEGRFRVPTDRPVTLQHTDGTVVYTPPPPGELPARIEKLCAFANAVTEGTDFLHPILRAILLHFWLAYDHPFVDGNGRTARALFYWSMLHSKYPLVEYISISEVILRRSGRYYESFLHTETDANDTTYFILDQLEVIDQSIRNLYDHIDRKRAELKENLHLLAHLPDLNHRQTQLLVHALKSPGAEYSVKSHAGFHDVSILTARKDLDALVRARLLVGAKSGKSASYLVPADLEHRLKTAGKR